ncbi:hypothetical protein [Erwinia amylovora]|uniref:hypothetical protein n=1 Tax=Erwinia amylovora TaxID=552 RepID=UPI0002CC43D2|nr:hypothetical protein [Erwinia amylovora]CCP05897.1 hypothetical protein BN440_0846 [Erwinia amylovora MR1]
MNKQRLSKVRLRKFKVAFIFLGGFLCGYSEASESWYVVDNYTGTIGKYSVHLSIQSYDFGGDVNVEGSYYYDRHNSPIVLFGKEKAGDIILCEISSKADFERYIVSGDNYDSTKCPFRITKHDQILKGEWGNKNIKLDVVLSKVASMNTTNIKSENGELDVPFWGQTDKHSFIGIYKQGKDRVIINEIKVLNKNNSQVVQVINPQDKNCDFGFHMTPIYQNVEQFSSSSISLNCYSTNSDVSVEYGLKGNKFLKNN